MPKVSVYECFQPDYRAPVCICAKTIVKVVKNHVPPPLEGWMPYSPDSTPSKKDGEYNLLLSLNKVKYYLMGLITINLPLRSLWIGEPGKDGKRTKMAKGGSIVMIAIYSL